MPSQIKYTKGLKQIASKKDNSCSAARRQAKPYNPDYLIYIKASYSSCLRVMNKSSHIETQSSMDDLQPGDGTVNKKAR